MNVQYFFFSLYVVATYCTENEFGIVTCLRDFPHQLNDIHRAACCASGKKTKRCEGEWVGGEKLILICAF